MAYTIFTEQLPPKGMLQSAVGDSREVEPIGTFDLAEDVNSLCPFETADLNTHVVDGKVSYGPVHSIWLCLGEPQLVTC